MRHIVIAIVLMVLHQTLGAQSFYAARQKRSLVFVGGTGTSTYLGELTNPGDYLDAKPNLTFGLQGFLGQRVGLRTEVTWFQLSGSDAKAGDPNRVPRNLSFTSNNFELNAVGILNLLPNGQRFYQRPNLNFYAFGGIGLLYFNPVAEYQGQKYALRPLQTELVAYSRSVVVFPYGLGVRVKMGPLFNVSIEGGVRKTFTDYLDDVSTVHHDASKFSDPVSLALSDRRPEIGLPRAEEGHIRGNPKTDDAYLLANVKLEYYLPVNFLERNKLYSKKRKNIYKRARRPNQARRRR